MTRRLVAGASFVKTIRAFSMSRVRVCVQLYVRYRVTVRYMRTCGLWSVRVSSRLVGVSVGARWLPSHRPTARSRSALRSCWEVKLNLKAETKPKHGRNFQSSPGRVCLFPGSLAPHRIPSVAHVALVGSSSGQKQRRASRVAGPPARECGRLHTPHGDRTLLPVLTYLSPSVVL